MSQLLRADNVEWGLGAKEVAAQQVREQGVSKPKAAPPGPSTSSPPPSSSPSRDAKAAAPVGPPPKAPWEPKRLS